MHSKVVVADNLLAALLAQAANEKILKGNQEISGWVQAARRNRRQIQEALSLLILFDQLILPISDYQRVQIPILLDEGILEVMPYSIFDLPDRGDNFSHILYDYEWVRPFVVNKLVRFFRDSRESAPSTLARTLHISRRDVVDSTIQFIQDISRGTAGADEILRKNRLYMILPHDISDWLLAKPMLRIAKGGNPYRSRSYVGNILLMMRLAGPIIAALLDISARKGATLASGEYGGSAEGWSTAVETDDPQQLARGLRLLRCAIHEEGRYFPRIENIKDAVRLRKDPNLQALKRQLTLFRSYLALGDRDAIAELRKEVQKAKQAIERTGRWENALKWVSYVALPVTAVEAILGAPPMVSGGMSAYTLGVKAAEDLTRRKNRWVLFGAPE